MTDWISTNDRVPELGSTVLVYIDSASGYYAIYMWGSVGSDRNITHWMPLSKPLVNSDRPLDILQPTMYNN